MLWFQELKIKPTKLRIIDVINPETTNGIKYLCALSTISETVMSSFFSTTLNKVTAKLPLNKRDTNDLIKPTKNLLDPIPVKAIIDEMGESLFRAVPNLNISKAEPAPSTAPSKDSANEISSIITMIEVHIPVNQTR